MLKTKRFTRPVAVDSLRQKWDTLPTRDQWALILLVMFLLIVVGGYAGYSLRHAASDKVLTYQDEVSDYFWLRAQADNIDITTQGAQSSAQNVNAEERVRQTLQAAGAMNTQVLTAGNGLQVAFEHSNQAIASKILAQLTQMGFNITQLDMTQDQEDNSIDVKATLQN